MKKEMSRQMALVLMLIALPLCALARMLAECGVPILREKEAPEG